MAAKDIYHDTVKTALLKDRWTITDDPLQLKAGGRDLYAEFSNTERSVRDLLPGKDRRDCDSGSTPQYFGF